MRDWTQLFKDSKNSGVYTITVDADIGKVRQAALTSGLEVFQVDVADVVDKDGFLKSVAESLQFPDYFGMNWDAFEECLIDLAWLPARGYILLIKSVGRFTEYAPREIKTARSTFKSAAKYWKKKETSFFVILSKAD